MAEIVNKILESVLPELRELERVGIFNEAEIRVVVRRRREFEYKLLRKPARKDDFLRAIQYELNLDKLRKRRKQRVGVVAVNRDGEFGIANRLHALFRRALKRFKGDVKLWLQYFQFCKQMNQKSLLGRMFSKALSIHPTHTGLWILAAKFEFEDMNDMETARTVFHQGLRANPHSKKLWLEYFRMELLHTDKLLKRRVVLGLDKSEDEKLSKFSDDVLDYKLAIIAYKQAVKSIAGDVEFRLAFLPILKLFKDTESVQQEIFDNIGKDFPTSALYWDALARRNWIDLSDSSSLSDSKVLELEEAVDGVFQEAMIVLEGGELQLLYDKYFLWCLSTRSAVVRVRKNLLSKLIHLSEETILRLIQLLCADGLVLEAKRVVEKATQNSSSLALWMVFCELMCSEDNFGMVCRKALQNVPAKLSLPIWNVWINQSILAESASDADTESIFQDCVATAVSPVREHISCQYLDWAVVTGGSAKMRTVYSRLLSSKPVPYSVYAKVITFEKSMDHPLMKRLRQVLDSALEEHGQTTPDLWLEYIDCEKSLAGGNLEKVGLLYWKAMKALDGNLTSEFIKKFSLMK